MRELILLAMLIGFCSNLSEADFFFSRSASRLSNHSVCKYRSCEVQDFARRSFVLTLGAIEVSTDTTNSTEQLSATADELARAAAFTQKFRKHMRKCARVILEFARDIATAKRELGKLLWQRALTDADLTVDIANKYLRIDKDK